MLIPVSQAVDCGHLANPDVKRVLVHRFDGTIIDVYGAKPLARNDYAIAQHVRDAPEGITGNCMRVQYDFVDREHSTSSALPQGPLPPPPPHTHTFFFCWMRCPWLGPLQTTWSVCPFRTT
jgi:hypothetical protein